MAVSTDTDIYVEDLFPAQYTSNPIQSTGNTGTKGHSYPNSPKKKVNKTVLLAAAAMIPFVIGIGIYKMVNQPPTIIKPRSVPAVVVQPPSTVNTPPNTVTDPNPTNIKTETQSNPRPTKDPPVGAPSNNTENKTQKKFGNQIVPKTTGTPKTGTTPKNGAVGKSNDCEKCNKYLTNSNPNNDPNQARILNSTISSYHTTNKH